MFFVSIACTMTEERLKNHTFYSLRTEHCISANIQIIYIGSSGNVFPISIANSNKMFVDLISTCTVTYYTKC